MLGGHLLKSWSSTQSQISLSSGEAEFYGVVRAGGTGLGFKSLMADLSVPLPLRVWTDSTATMGVCGRQGLGRLRHVDTQCLWIQQRIRDGSIELRKVKGEINPADLFTKHLPSRDKVRQLLSLFNCEFEDGRAAGAPKLKGHDEESEPVLNLVGNEFVELEGMMYNGVWSEGELVPEAYAHDPERLPHTYPEKHLERMFPRAIAAPSPGDADPEENTSWLQRGLDIGVRTKWRASTRT